MKLPLILLFAASAAWAQEGLMGIRDNSFLIEEGYNQQRGVLQHILTHRTDWAAEGPQDAQTQFEFTQEWPLWGEKLQGSFTVPLAAEFEGVDLHFRYQLMNEPQEPYSVAPRLSFLLDYDADLEFKHMLGYQVNLPISKEFDSRRAVHANIGATFEPPSPGFTDYWGDGSWVYNLGVSGIYAVRPNLHAMAELLNITQDDAPPAYVVNPGVRYAINMQEGPQWVFGVSAPIGFTESVDSYGLFLYLSLEHGFLGD